MKKDVYLIYSRSTHRAKAMVIYRTLNELLRTNKTLTETNYIPEFKELPDFDPYSQVVKTDDLNEGISRVEKAILDQIDQSLLYCFNNLPSVVVNRPSSGLKSKAFLDFDWKKVISSSFYYSPEWFYNSSLFVDLFFEVIKLNKEYHITGSLSEIFNIFFALYAEKAKEKENVSITNIYHDSLDTLYSHFEEVLRCLHKRKKLLEPYPKEQQNYIPIKKLFNKLFIREMDDCLLHTIDALFFHYLILHHFDEESQLLVEALKERDDPTTYTTEDKRICKEIDKKVLKLLSDGDIFTQVPSLSVDFMKLLLEPLLYYCSDWVLLLPTLQSLILEFVEKVKEISEKDEDLLSILLLVYLVIQSEGVQGESFTPVPNALELCMYIIDSEIQSNYREVFFENETLKNALILLQKH